MKTAICTIGTESHLFKSKALLSSLERHSSADRFCLLTDARSLPEPVCGETYHTPEILTSPLASALKKKYRGNALRWSCKPLYLLYLLELGYDRVIYVDNDICFFSPADFLFEELENVSVMLTPHFYAASPGKSANWFEANFWVGLYNAGFVGATQNGLPALYWWAECCLYNVKQSAWRGLFDDQKYLDLLPVVFDDVKILKHKGCNVAGWNIETCPRTLRDGYPRIADRWLVVFVHFTPLTFTNILSGKDPALAGLLETYLHALKEWNPRYSPEPRRRYRDYLLYLRHTRWRFIRFFE